MESRALPVLAVQTALANWLEAGDAAGPPSGVSRFKRTLAAKLHLAFVPTNADLLACATPAQRVHLEAILRMKPTRTLSGVAIVTIQSSPVGCPHGTCTFCPGGPTNDLTVNGVAIGPSAQSYTGREPAALRAIRHAFDPYEQTRARLADLSATGHSVDKIDFVVQGGTFPARTAVYQNWFLARAFEALNDFVPGEDGAATAPGAANAHGPLGRPEAPAVGPHDGDTPARIVPEHRLRGPPPAVPLDHTARPTRDAAGEAIDWSSRLAAAQSQNESAHARMIGLTIETKPDWCRVEHVQMMLTLGGTRVEIGVQTVFDEELALTKRGHTVADSIEATRLAKDAGLKVCHHVMPGLPGSTPERDLEAFRRICEDSDWAPDMLKIYPTLVVPGTELYRAWERGEYTPPTEEDCVTLLAKAKTFVPPWMRIQRIDRDIPTTLVSAGVMKSNLRELVHARMRQDGTRCRCIRCRESGRVPGAATDVQERYQWYRASGGVEHFVSFEDPGRDAIVAFVRVREPSGEAQSAFLEDLCAEPVAFLRELRVVGREVSIAAAPGEGQSQHRGLGSALLHRAEEIARDRGARRLLVTAGVGVRAYYMKRGYVREGPYVAKRL
ncbi:MAG: tRNA uridine(34) 5-carboxymethylaminomethyl modification radical SAM/GNAT enzyme Elp3 [Thermoplasmatota archaeon]